jgi:hypothetical protein
VFPVPPTPGPPATAPPPDPPGIPYLVLPNGPNASVPDPPPPPPADVIVKKIEGPPEPPGNPPGLLGPVPAVPPAPIVIGYAVFPQTEREQEVL